MVERWFPDADTNAVLLMLVRCSEPEARANNVTRFVRLRRPLGSLLAVPSELNRRQSIEDLLEAIVTADPGVEDPRLTVNQVTQGAEGGLAFADDGNEQEEALVFEDEGIDEE